jgi:hypothetical protein
VRLWTKANHGVGRQVPVTAGLGTLARLRRPQERGVELVILPAVGGAPTKGAPKKQKSELGPQFFVLGTR